MATICCTSLSIASRNGHLEIVKELVLHLVDVNVKNFDGETPLHSASWHG